MDMFSHLNASNISSVHCVVSTLSEDNGATDDSDDDVSRLGGCMLRVNSSADFAELPKPTTRTHIALPRLDRDDDEGDFDDIHIMIKCVFVCHKNQ